MSMADISDVQLDRLLGHAPPLSAPSLDLADRIVARALRTPQARARLLPLPRRHGPRRRTAVWSTIVAANIMAAAAAAASWDGRQFDFQRLADLPRRVVAAVRDGHHHPGRRPQTVREHPRVTPQIASVSRHETKAAPLRQAVHSLPVVIVPRAVPLHVSSQAALHVHGTARARFQRQGLAAQPFRFVSPAPRKDAELHRRSIASDEPVDKREPGLPRTPQSQAVVPNIDERAAEPTERSAASADHQQSPVAASKFARADENAPRRSGAIAAHRARQADLERRWRSQFYKRIHPRERGGRFRGRF